MTEHRRRAARPLFPFVAIALAILAVGCGFGSSDTPKPTSSHGALGSPPALTAVPGGHASPVVGASIGPPTTTEAEWGTIFDSLPASFPELPGQERADTGAGPTSGSFAANMSVADARKLMEVSLIAQGWTVAVGSPLEDGTVVVEAAGAKAGCKAEVRLTPMSGTVIMSVLYGATCPFS